LFAWGNAGPDDEGDAGPDDEGDFAAPARQHPLSPKGDVRGALQERSRSHHFA
jgi:hypothetical protein